jgi:hypothetical protein
MSSRYSKEKCHAKGLTDVTLAMAAIAMRLAPDELISLPILLSNRSYLGQLTSLMRACLGRATAVTQNACAPAARTALVRCLELRCRLPCFV